MKSLEQPRNYSDGTCTVAVSGTTIGAGPGAGAGAGGLGLLSLCRLRRRWENGLRLSRHWRWSRLRLLHRSRRRYHVGLCRNGRGHHMLSRDRYGRWRWLCRHWRRGDFRLCRCWFRRRRSLGVRRGRGSGRLWLRPRRDCGGPRFRLCRGLRLLRRFLASPGCRSAPVWPSRLASRLAWRKIATANILR